MDTIEPKAVSGYDARRDDGAVRIIVSDDALEARGDFSPPIGDGRPLDPDGVATALAQANVVAGVDWDAVGEALLDANLNRRLVRGILVARGQAPVEEVQEYFELDPAFRHWPALPDGDVPRIDFREISPFIVVRRDQVLAEFRPKIPGSVGADVRGAAVPFTVRRPESCRPGRNTHQSPEAIIADCDGRLVEKGGELTVEETLSVKGSVGYGTGHIVFPGDVVIDGPVADGFKVYAGGSIAAKQTMDATEVIAKKDLIVAGGLIGRGRAMVRVGGTLRVRFIQQCRVACRGPIVAGLAVVNSQIYTLQSLDLGDKGHLVGGEVFAVHGVRAAAIGGAASPAAKIHCGVDFTVQQDLDRANERLRLIALKLGRLRQLIAEAETPASAAPPDDRERTAQLEAWSRTQAKLAAEQATAASSIGELLGKLDVDETAQVEVHGDIAPGTLIEICHVAFFVDKPLRKVRFRLEKEKGRLIHEPL